MADSNYIDGTFTNMCRSISTYYSDVKPEFAQCRPFLDITNGILNIGNSNAAHDKIETNSNVTVCTIGMLQLAYEFIILKKYPNCHTVILERIFNINHPTKTNYDDLVFCDVTTLILECEGSKYNEKLRAMFPNVSTLVMMNGSSIFMDTFINKLNLDTLAINDWSKINTGMLHNVKCNKLVVFLHTYNSDNYYITKSISDAITDNFHIKTVIIYANNGTTNVNLHLVNTVFKPAIDLVCFNVNIVYGKCTYNSLLYKSSKIYLCNRAYIDKNKKNQQLEHIDNVDKTALQNHAQNIGSHTTRKVIVSYARSSGYDSGSGSGGDW